MEQVETFRILSDETRLRALALMAVEGELCVCEFVAAMQLSQPKISRHLAALRDAGLVTARRNAQWVFYQLQTTLPAWKKQVLEAAVEGIKDEIEIKQDLTRLSAMQNRPLRRAA